LEGSPRFFVGKISLSLMVKHEEEKIEEEEEENVPAFVLIRTTTKKDIN
jgi:hypothetical protein